MELFFVMGIYEIRTERGLRLFSKSRQEVAGAKARDQGLFPIILGVIIMAVFILANR